LVDGQRDGFLYCSIHTGPSSFLRGTDDGKDGETLKDSLLANDELVWVDGWMDIDRPTDDVTIPVMTSPSRHHPSSLSLAHSSSIHRSKASKTMEEEETISSSAAEEGSTAAVAAAKEGGLEDAGAAEKQVFYSAVQSTSPLSSATTQVGWMDG